AVHGLDRRPYALVLSRAVRVREAVPEIVLDTIGGIEDHAEDVGRVALHEPERRSGPAARQPAEAIEVVEGARDVPRGIAAEPARRLEIDLVARELVRELGRMGERLAWRRQHAADDEPLHRTERIRRRQVHDADPTPRAAEDVPHGRAADVARIRDPAGLVAVWRHAREREDAVGA